MPNWRALTLILFKLATYMDIFEMRATEHRLTNQVAALRNMLHEVDESLADIEQTIHGDNADKIANLRGWIEAVLAATQPDNKPLSWTP